MQSTGTSMARVATAPSIEAPQPTVALETPEVGAAYWFFWVVAVAAVDSLFAGLGSRIHRLSGFGIASLLERFVGGGEMLHAIVSGWMAAFLLILGFSALRGWTPAFKIGVAVLACDTLLLFAFQDYFSIPFHAFVIYQLYLGIAAAGRQSSN